MRFTNILLAYFMIGAIMWAGGAIAWDDAGVGGLFIDTAEDPDVNESTSTQIREAGGPIQEAAGSTAVGLIAIWNLLVKLLGFLFWPITVLLSVNAPPRVVVVLGGSFCVAFYGALIRVIRRSA